MELSKYKSIIFDCDGVVLNSNRVKTNAFYIAALPYGQESAQSLVDYHVKNGGISRYKKFDLFLERMVDQPLPDLGLAELLQTYATEVRSGLLMCELASGLAELRTRSAGANWMIVSGGDQNELRDIFDSRQIAALFESGIFGSPDTKDEILEREISSGRIQFPALFLGDSQYDFEAASRKEIDFVFVSAWSESAYSFEGAIARINTLSDLLQL